MAKKTIKTKTTGDPESRIKLLEERITALEQLSKKFNRKKKEYNDEQRAAIRTRLLAGQEAARKRREKNIDDVTITKSVSHKPIKPKNAVKTKPVQPPKQS